MIPERALARRRGPKVRQVSIPAPVGGWNSRDPMDAMPITDAVELVNWFPDTGHVRLRKGYSSHATGMAGAVETIASLSAGTISKMIAAGGGSIYDATSVGAATSLASGFTESRWQSATMNATIGLVNGTDAPQVYDGSTCAAMTVSGSGLTVADLIGVNVFKSRSYFWEANSQQFWYSAVNVLGGALTVFPLNRVGTFGGNLMSMSTWTIDGGSGKDDLAAFVMTSGEVIVYQGSDPGTAADWALVGVYQIPRPVDVRGILRYGGDLLVLTEADAVPLSRALPNGGATIQETKLSGALRDAYRAHSTNSGWQAFLYPGERMMLFNVPLSTTKFEQYGLNTATGAAFRFTGVNAYAWGLHGGLAYFGAAGGIVYKFWDTFGDAGTNIESDAQQAWSDLGSQTVKRVPGIRPVFSAPGELTAAVGIGFDFRNPQADNVISNPNIDTPWGSPWNSPWSAEDRVRAQWRYTFGTGHKVSARIKTGTNVQDVRWFSTDYRFEPGVGL